MRPYARQVAGLLTIGSLCGIVMNTAVVLPAVLLGRAIDAVLTAERLHSGSTPVTRAVLLLVAGTVATELPRVGKRFWLGVCKNRIRANVRADALASVLGWPAARLHTTSVGELMARIVGDVEVLGTGVREVIVETWDMLLFSAVGVRERAGVGPAGVGRDRAHRGGRGRRCVRCWLAAEFARPSLPTRAAAARNGPRWEVLVFPETAAAAAVLIDELAD